MQGVSCRTEGFRSASAHPLAWQRHSLHSVGQEASFIANLPKAELPKLTCSLLQVLVLGWCVSQRDIEVVRKVVQQLCVARGCEGNRTVGVGAHQQGSVFERQSTSSQQLLKHCCGSKHTQALGLLHLGEGPSLLLPLLLLQIVVMTQRSKLDMEEMFRRCLPQSQRFGTNLVFRKGSPLLPSDLEMVAAHSAAATIVVSDQSRSADEADAQATRCVWFVGAGLQAREAQSAAHLQASSGWCKQSQSVMTLVAFGGQKQ